MADEAMESYLYSAYSPYAYRYPAPKGKGGAGGWRARGGGGYVAGYAEPTAADYFDNYQRAQLRAILAQVSPGLTPRLRKANTREEPAQGKARLRFQFLEQKYGYYHCKDCNIRWESAYVWCVQGTSKVYFRQFCRTCQKSYNPYRVEDITCQSCKQTRCTCPVKMRHVDPKRPHRQDLCGRCKGKRLSCDSTFSFKYII
ncbi:zygote arrest protein 1 [Alligator mississippiensis]|uniref:Zygote arrest protein 1 n=1 Tax=Alligator mississippiensis TaxID=8496 RepID=A0A151PAN7_ALLMI|nr:zygote arrest protein 1 [Alligator mississippiensis]